MSLTITAAHRLMTLAEVRAWLWATFSEPGKVRIAYLRFVP